MDKWKITYSDGKRIKNQKLILESLGLKGIGREVTHVDSKTILGMINKVKHLIEVNDSDA